VGGLGLMVGGLGLMVGGLGLMGSCDRWWRAGADADRPGRIGVSWAG
jgi:hypothetical protein